MPSLRSAYSSTIVTLFVAFFAFACLQTSLVHGATPQVVTFQGKLTDTSGIALEDGIHSIRLAIYDSPTGGTLLWDAGAQNVTTVDGLFTYELGSNVSLPASLFTDTARFLGITVGNDAELSPRIPFRSVPYAIESSHSAKSDSALVAQTATSASQADSATFAQISEVALSATVSEFADSATSADSADVATNAHALEGMSPLFYLDWNNLTNVPAGFADGIDNGATVSAGTGLQLVAGVFSIQPGGVTETLIADNAVTAAKIAADAVGSSEVQNNSLTSVDLAANSVGSSEIINGSVSNVDIAANSIGAVQIIANTIDSNKIADSSISGADIAPNSIGAEQIKNNSFSSADILDEPGVAQISAAWFLTTPSLTTIASHTINCPGNGFVMALANFEMKVDHVAGTASQAIVGLSNASSSLPSDQNKNEDIPGTANSGTYTSIVSLQRIFTVSAGANTFYVLGRKTTSASPTWSTFDVTFSLVYYPTAYGTVSATPPAPPIAPASDK